LTFPQASANSALQGKVIARRTNSDLIGGKGEFFASNLAYAEPCIELNTKQCLDSKVFHLEVLPVLPYLLHTIKLLPE
jgi:hypothetical protein